jgi:hypothetical protein
MFRLFRVLFRVQFRVLVCCIFLSCVPVTLVRLFVILELSRILFIIFFGSYLFSILALYVVFWHFTSVRIWLKITTTQHFKDGGPL